MVLACVMENGSAGRAREELPKAREAPIAPRTPTHTRRVHAVPFPVRVPQLDQRIFHRSTSAREHAPGKVSHDAARDRRVDAELNEVVVLVERDVVRERIVRPCVTVGERVSASAT